MNEDHIYQHIVPKCYLKYFSPDKKKIWVKKLNEKPSFDNISEVGGENYFYDINTNTVFKTIKHAYFNPFKDSIKIISDHELLIGAEEYIFLIDYKKYLTLSHFMNDNSYSICKYSEDCLLCNYRDRFIKTYKMIRKNGKLEFEYKNKLKIHNKQIVGMVQCPDGKFITYSMDECLKIWKTKNISK